MAYQSEEAKVIAAEQSNTEVISAFNRIPYALINREVDTATNDVLAELTEIVKYYKIYRDGASFSCEGSNGDYVPATLKYKMAASLVDKEARFLFAESPTIDVVSKGDLGIPTKDSSDMITALDDMVREIFEENKFDQQILKAARDCFIGKRVAALVNFNEDEGVTISFLPATQFVYKYKMNSQKLQKFVAFIIIQDSINLSIKRVFMKKYEVEYTEAGTGDIVYLTEELYDGAGRLIEEVTPRQPLAIDFIPAVIITNDGLIGDIDGESEIETLKDYESWYSKLSNGDLDSARKSMNQIKYVVDMDRKSTKSLSTAPGAFWDLGSDQDIENPSTQVGTIESNMGYSGALKTSLDRIKTTGYEQIDMPNITLDSMTGVVSSGKALKAVYWPLIVRCKEKMKTWGPQLQQMVKYIIDGAMAYPNCVVDYTDANLFPVAYEVHVEQNLPLPEDEIEEKNMDIAEVNSMVMSKKSYMQKWRDLTDDEVNEELQQMALERQILEDSAMPGMDQQPYPEDEDADGDASIVEEMPDEDEQSQDELTSEGNEDDVNGSENEQNPFSSSQSQ